MRQEIERIKFNLSIAEETLEPIGHRGGGSAQMARQALRKIRGVL